MEWFVWAMVGLFVFGVARTVLARKRNPLREVPLEELPATLRAELQRIVPDFRAEQIRVTGNVSNAYLKGSYLGQPASVEADFDGAGSLQELEFDAVEGSRSRRGIARAELPEAAAREIDRVLGDQRASFEERALTGGTFAGEGNYEADGVSDDWKWEIEVSASGRLLEFEMEKRRR